jgi:hypothetical protein
MGPHSNHNYDNILQKKKKKKSTDQMDKRGSRAIYICHDHELVTYTM